MKKLIASLALFFAFSFSATAQTANGRATSTAPSYANGVASPLSLDLLGNLRTNCVIGCGSGSSFNSAFPATGQAIGLSDGTNMLPFRGDITNGLWVNIKSPATFPISAAALPLPSGAATAANQSTLITNLGSPFQAGGNIGNTAFGISGTLPAFAAIPAFKIDQTTPGTTNAVQTIAGVVGGASKFSLISSATTNSNNVKGSGGTLYAVQVYNNSANIAYLKFYDKATAPTCNTDTVVKEILIPASTNGAGSNFSIDPGAIFFNGIGICVTAGIAVNDNTAVAANAYIVNLDFK